MLHKEIADQWTRIISEIARYDNSFYIFSFLILITDCFGAQRP